MRLFQNKPKKDDKKPAAPEKKPAPEKKEKKEEKKEKPQAVNIVPLLPPTIPPPDSPSEQVSVSVTASREEEDVLVHISALTGPGTIRTPLDVCCVVDISGSMSNAASIKDGTGKEEQHGLSVLDVVKHAVKTIISSLEAYDRVAVIAFESSSHVTLPLTPASDVNKKDAIEKVDALHPMGGTNLWSGLETGLELLRKNGDNSRFPALLVLTDGMPDSDPKDSLRKYKDSHPLPTIGTFGFGYSVETGILLNIANEGSGMHAFIPDASFVGTAFVNAISNLMVTVANRTTLSIEAENGAVIKEVYGYPHQKTSWGALVDLGSLQYGQTRDAVVRLSLPTPGGEKEKEETKGEAKEEKKEMEETKGEAEETKEETKGEVEAEKKEEEKKEEEKKVETRKPFVRATLKYRRVVGQGEMEEREGECAEIGGAGVKLEVNRARLLLAGELTKIIHLGQGDAKKAEEEREALHAQIATIADPQAEGIAQDIAGQVKEALQRDGKEDFYQKWGRHYLPSLARAHLLQQCNNFKDPGIQFYGGQIFQTLRDKIEDIFVKLPPPKPSVRKNYGGYGGGAAAPTANLASMRTYYNVSGGCIAGECIVRMANGEEKRVGEVEKGDVVCVGEKGEKGEVVCVVETRCREGRESLVALPGGLRLTPYHPVLVEGEWKFPIDLATAERDVECDAVFNFVLSGPKHAMVINGVSCITLGHGLEGPVAGHSYFGTQRVVDDLRAMRGWDAGRVVLRAGASSAAQRDAKTGLVCALTQDAAADSRAL